MAQTRTRRRQASTIELDRDKFREFFMMRRINLNDIGPLFGRCSGWGHTIVYKGHAGFNALDELACALDMHVDDLIYQIGTDYERERIDLVNAPIE